ncbi:sulfite oxidase-like oxidoreductase [Nocardiopsis sp. MG754419]|uniref:sulfite oxidase-like oxidoreductase n=1 Tax=Nocardiopsis sp. MG754419 TaxID=2259865 RepID=UPI001BAE254A|nr:sulfite oxidase-like oxidoreductase [Nocardiopsis sp. MG754419]MBR8744070.1 sulfite oxidase-like oxidoreductase [Nocardiopsis sp. MG754419]
MNTVTRGFHGRRGGDPDRIPPGQYETSDFPVLSVGPTPRVDTDEWTLAIVNEAGQALTWSWDAFMALPQEHPHVDIHCVTRWSRLDTDWVGVSLDVLLEDVETTAEYALALSHGGYSTDVPLEDLTDGRAWIAHTFDGEPLAPEHGGPARLIVPHLYFWKSAKWVREIRLLHEDDPGFWEQAGYHSYGDPWREQRYQGD